VVLQIDVANAFNFVTRHNVLKTICCWAYLDSRYPKGQFNEKRIVKDYFGFYYIYYFMIIVDWYMTITGMMSC